MSSESYKQACARVGLGPLPPFPAPRPGPLTNQVHMLLKTPALLYSAGREDARMARQQASPSPPAVLHRDCPSSSDAAPRTPSSCSIESSTLSCPQSLELAPSVHAEPPAVTASMELVVSLEILASSASLLPSIEQ